MEQMYLPQHLMDFCTRGEIQEVCLEQDHLIHLVVDHEHLPELVPDHFLVLFGFNIQLDIDMPQQFVMTELYGHGVQVYRVHWGWDQP